MEKALLLQEKAIITRHNKTKQGKLPDEFAFLTNYKSGELQSPTLAINPNIQTLTRVSTNGTVKFCNADFSKITGLTKRNKFSGIIHPSMPKTIFNYVKHQLENKQDAMAIVKHIDKDGNSFWMNVHYSPNTTDNFNVAVTIKSNATAQNKVERLNKIYTTLFLLEKHHDQTIASKYFEGLLDMVYGNYDGFLIDAFQ